MPQNCAPSLTKINSPIAPPDTHGTRRASFILPHNKARAAKLGHHKIRHGHWPSCSPAPVQAVGDTKVVSKVAVVGADFPQLRPTLKVSLQDQVAAGQVLFTDRKHPQIAHVSPVAGTVVDIEYGPRRTLSAFVIERDPNEVLVHETAPIDDNTEASIRRTLLDRGMWPAFRTRPFGRTPTPESKPVAIFVTATQKTASAPDPHVVLEGRLPAFDKGVAVLTELTEGTVHVCQSKEEPLCQAADRVNVVVFSGTAAAGLPSTHVDRLYPVQSGGQVWTIGYQDVAAIGHLFQTGQYSADRVVSITGAMAKAPKLVRTTLGASLSDVLAGEFAPNARPVFLSGDALTGVEASFLGRFHDQITLNERPAAPAERARRTRFNSISRALIPKTALERALAPRILPVPFMRALSVGDSEAARRLGCLALVEEDLAVLSRLCTSGADYGVLLRHVLDDLMEDAA